MPISLCPSRDMIMYLIDAYLVNQENIFSRISALKIGKKLLGSILPRKSKLSRIRGLGLQSQGFEI